MTRLRVALALTVGTGAVAFEAEPTHAALTESAMHASGLSEALEHWGHQDGLYQPIVLDLASMDRISAVRLTSRLRAIDPGSGYAPVIGETRRVHSGAAGAWLLAGAVVEEFPVSRGRHHFLDPVTGKGLDDSRAGLSLMMRVLSAVDAGGTVSGIFTGTNFDLTGTPANAWAVSERNEQSYSAFLSHLVDSAQQPERVERERHLAQALLALGGILHLLQDMASPSHVRNDFREAHLDARRGSVFARSSAFERYVALSYGSTAPAVGMPGPKRMRLADFFHAEDGKGLADFTAANFFSPATLPTPTPLRAGEKPAAALARVNLRLRRAEPRLAYLGRQAGYGGSLVRHLARYRVDRDRTLRFSLDQACHGAYARVLLAEAVRSSRDLLDFALRGRLELSLRGGRLEVTNRGVALAEGSLQVLWEDVDGKRQTLASPPATVPARVDGQLAQASVSVPKDAVRLVAVFEGRDAWGEPLVAIETVTLARELEN